MSRLMVLFALSVLLAACGKGLVPDPSGGLPPGDDEIPETGAEVSHGMIVLGDKLENPYTTENMRDALVSLYPTKSRNEVRTSHLYVRFLPADQEEFDMLESIPHLLLLLSLQPPISCRQKKALPAGAAE